MSFPKHVFFETYTITRFFSKISEKSFIIVRHPRALAPILICSPLHFISTTKWCVSISKPWLWFSSSYIHRTMMCYSLYTSRIYIDHSYYRYSLISYLLLWTLLILLYKNTCAYMSYFLLEFIFVFLRSPSSSIYKSNVFKCQLFLIIYIYFETFCYKLEEGWIKF